MANSGGLPGASSANCAEPMGTMIDGEVDLTAGKVSLSLTSPDGAEGWQLFSSDDLALYVALNNIFGGSCDIAPANYPEFYVQVIR